jgi:hypothetical protein
MAMDHKYQGHMRTFCRSKQLEDLELSNDPETKSAESESGYIITIYQTGMDNVRTGLQ